MRMKFSDSILIFAVVLLAAFLLYFLEVSNFLSYHLPLPVYLSYLHGKFTHLDELGAYILVTCQDKTQQTVYVIYTGHVFGETYEQHFNSEGQKVCENFFEIQSCKDACPYLKCSENYTSCTTLTGNKRIWGWSE